ncbi:MAG: hypothetical protein ACOC8N_03415 [Spirochaetota bacterium]
MDIAIQEVRNRRDRKTFLKLPYRLHRGRSYWVPPLLMREKAFIDPRKNPHMAYSDTVLYLAWGDGKPVGRVMGIINHKLNQRWNDRQARFCNFESIDNLEAARELLGSVEQWARGRDMERVIGPLGFSNQDPQGFLVEGFQERPSIGTIYNFEYVPRLVEACGYSKEVDYVTYCIPIPETIPPLYEKISQRLLGRSSVRMLEFQTKRAMKPWIRKVLHFMNETYTDIYGFIPLTDEIIEKTARTYCEIVDPRLLKVVVDGERNIVSFILGIQDITEGFQKARGRLLPIGYFIIKSAQKKSNCLDLLLGAIKKEYRGKGLDTLMAIAMIRSARDMGLEYSDSHHELETNTLVQAEMKKLGGEIYKRHRVYQKKIC